MSVTVTSPAAFFALVHGGVCSPRAPRTAAEGTQSLPELPSDLRRAVRVGIARLRGREPALAAAPGA